MIEGTTAYIGLGSNLGDRRRHIETGLAQLDEVDGVDVIAAGSIVETEAVGPVAQGPFLNTAAFVRTTLSARALLEACQAIESALGRAADGPGRTGPRALDLDLLLFADEIIDEPGLVVPHPRMHDRWFVLAPLAEISPDARHPGLERTIAELLTRVESPRVS